MEKRKSDKGIVFQKGERQLPDGRYRYRYTDPEGKSHDVYSWRLRPQDPVPEGKKPGPSLREMEDEIRRNLEDGIKAWQAGLKVSELVAEYLESAKSTLSGATEMRYRQNFECHIKNSSFGKKAIKKVTPNDVYVYYRNLLEANKWKIDTLSSIDKLISPAFDVAVKKKLIAQNPADGVVADIRKKYRNVESVQPEIKHAVSQEQLGKFLQLVKDDSDYKKYYNLIYLLAWTGCRIGEMLALSWYDIDFENEIIIIRRNLSSRKVNGHKELYFKIPKSRAGIREIPMLQDVKDILTDMKRKDKITIFPDNNPPKLDVKNAGPLLFKTSNNTAYDYTHIDRFFQKLERKYSCMYSDQIRITPHILRHSFTCWLIENLQEESPSASIKAVQSILGHADASTTLNIYSELRKEAKEEVFKKLKDKAAR